MEDVSETKAADQPAERERERERSTIAFPHTDLDNAVEVVRAVHAVGGSACDSDQIAAQLGLEAKGGGFRLRLNGARVFGLLTYDRGGRVALTELGMQMADPHQERQAKANAFLAVELHQRVYEHFKGGPLPPQAGLERTLEGMGVGSKVKEKARQVLLRSAKQAGFFEHAPDRLVKPSVKQNPSRATSHSSENDRGPEHEQGGSRKTGVGAPSSSGGHHPLIQGLLLTLPEPGDEWPAQERVNWLTMAASIFKMIYTEPSPSVISVIVEGGTTSATQGGQ